MLHAIQLDSAGGAEEYCTNNNGGWSHVLSTAELVVGHCVQVEMYPSKSDGMFVPESLIFRSDSNGEDLEGYAGAGLYDSITMDTTELRKVDYASDK